MWSRTLWVAATKAGALGTLAPVVTAKARASISPAVLGAALGVAGIALSHASSARDDGADMSGRALCRGLFINNKYVRPVAGGSMPVIDPSNESVITQCPTATAADVDIAVKSARKAFESWGATTGAHRAAILRRIAAGVKARKADLAKLEVADNGKPLPEAEWDIDDVAGAFEYYADLAEALDKKQGTVVPVPDGDYKCFMRYEPVGVVAAITPWNYPMLMSTWKVAPALAAGCCVVLKPSELAPITSLELGEIAAEAGLPAGVLSILSGTGPDAGDPLVRHAGVDKVTFTGSGPTGSKIMARCATDIRGVSLELGGKSPAIVFSDTDIDKTVEWVMFGCFWTNGQICSATSRLLVHSSIADRFLTKLAAETKKLKVGDPFDPSTNVGPVVSAGQYKKVMAYIEGAKRDGATVLAGGGRPSYLDHRGYFVEPTVFVNVTADMPIWRQEVFGPVLAVMTFDTEEQAIAMANDSEYGLAAAVFTDDEARMARVTKALRCGIVWNNCDQPAFVQMPWGGMKRSGIGRDLGEFGFNSFLEPKAVTSYKAKAPLGWYFNKSKL